jgi:hypothetical protein
MDTNLQQQSRNKPTGVPIIQSNYGKTWLSQKSVIQNVMIIRILASTYDPRRKNVYKFTWLLQKP